LAIGTKFAVSKILRAQINDDEIKQLVPAGRYEDTLLQPVSSKANITSNEEPVVTTFGHH
jgi:hypothetical protein